MKRLITILGLVIALLGLSAGLAYHYRVDLYDAAMTLEREKGHLALKSITVDGLEIRYLEGLAGEGREPLVLIHGFAATKENWLRLAAELSDRYYILAPDLPGHGESDKPLDREYGIPAQTRFLDQFLTAAGVTEPVSLAGNSMGGAIASWFAANYPQRVKTLLLLDPAGVDDTPAELADWLARGENPLVIKDTESFETLIDFAMEKPPVIPWPITQVVVDRASQNRAVNDLIFAQIRQLDRQAFKDALRSIKAPTLVLWGEKDRIINVANADVFDALIPASQKKVLPGIGHAPMIEVPKETAELIATFIQAPAKPLP